MRRESRGLSFVKILFQLMELNFQISEESMYLRDIDTKNLKISNKNYQKVMCRMGLVVSALIANGVSLFLLILTERWLHRNGVAYEGGCHGPEMTFGLLSGVLLVLQIRFLDSYFNAPKK